MSGKPLRAELMKLGDNEYVLGLENITSLHSATASPNYARVTIQEFTIEGIKELGNDLLKLAEEEKDEHSRRLNE